MAPPPSAASALQRMPWSLPLGHMPLKPQGHVPHLPQAHSLLCPLVRAVWQGMSEGRPVVGVAYVDGGSRQLGVAQLDDDEQLCALEAIIVQLGAKEAVVCKVGRRVRGRRWLAAPAGACPPWHSPAMRHREGAAVGWCTHARREHALREPRTWILVLPPWCESDF